MSDHYYLSRNSSSPDGDPGDFQSKSDDSPASESRRRYGDSCTVSTQAQHQQFRCINQNNQRITWNILLTDDQDGVSQHFLRMYHEPTLATEKFGPDILMVPENIRKQADELFKPSEINPNEIFDLVNTKASWILPSLYRQYLKTIHPNELEKKERHVLYPWTRWNNNGTLLASHQSSQPRLHRPSSSSVGGTSPASSSDRSSLSSSLSLSLSPSSSSSRYTLTSTTYGQSPPVNGGINRNNDNSSIDYYGEAGAGSTATAETSPSAVCSDWNCPMAVTTAAVESPSVYWPVQGSPQQQQQQRRQQVQANSWAAAGRSVSSADLYDDEDRSPPPPPPSRMFYCVNTDSNTINKLVEHYCTFCYKNHEPPEVYGSHLVRDATRTTCPKLRALRCKHCHGTGDNAHTIKYCPFLYANYG